MIPKQTRIRWPAYLDWQREQPCEGCGRWPTAKVKTIPAHQRGLGGGGTALKPDDTDSVPLCDYCHKLEGQGAEEFWGAIGKDPGRVCTCLVFNAIFLYDVYYKPKKERRYVKQQEEDGRS